MNRLSFTRGAAAAVAILFLLGIGVWAVSHNTNTHRSSAVVTTTTVSLFDPPNCIGVVTAEDIELEKQYAYAAEYGLSTDQFAPYLERRDQSCGESAGDDGAV
jgi:outer membrane receptor for ferrienterochelin and colicin